MLIHDGEQRFLGDPEEAALRYYRLNFAGTRDPGGPDSDVEVLDAWLEDPSGRRLTDVEQDQQFTVKTTLAVKRELPAPAVGFELLNVDGVSVLGFGTNLQDDEGRARQLAPGARISLSTEVDARLVPGRYSIICSVARSRAGGDDALRDLRLLDFLVKGSDPVPGMVSVQADVQALVESGS
jgi:hypothetical protein